MTTKDRAINEMTAAMFSCPEFGNGMIFLQAGCDGNTETRDHKAEPGLAELRP